MVQKGSNDMAKWISIGVTLIVISAGCVSAFPVAGQRAQAACNKADSTEKRVTKLETDVAFFQGSVNAKLDGIDKKQTEQSHMIEENDKEQNRKLDKITEFMMNIERAE
jgi:hypothetical protein